MNGTRIVLTKKDTNLDKFDHQLEKMTDRQVKLVLVRAGKHEGQKAYTAVKRVLTREAGLGKYGFSSALVKFKPPNFGNLEVAVWATGGETNIAKFGGHMTKRAYHFAQGDKPKGWRNAKSNLGGGFFASPWGRTRHFPRTFMANGMAFHRIGKSRLPIGPAFGPNIARELTRPYVQLVWSANMRGLADRVEHEIGRMLTAG